MNGGNEMEKNVGGIDRNIRIILGIVLMVAGLFIHGGTVVKTLIFGVAAIAFVTAYTGF